MSVKIKINWDNENVVSESVRIYRADSAFTSSNLPPLLAEIIGDVYEYEDFSVTEGATYFYTLSVKLGEQEVFTECYEVVVKKVITYLPINYSNISSMGSGSGTTQVSGLNFQEFGTSNDQQIIVVLAVSFVDVITPAGWVKSSSLNNVHIFWKKGGSPHAIHHFQLASPNFLGLYAIALNVTGAFNRVEILAKNINSTLETSSTVISTPILDVANEGPSYQLNTIRLNNLGGGAFVATWSGGLTKIKDGTGYQASLCVAGIAKEKDSQIGGQTVSVNYWNMPNAVNLQTIQICAYLD